MIRDVINLLDSINRIKCVLYRKPLRLRQVRLLKSEPRGAQGPHYHRPPAPSTTAAAAATATTTATVRLPKV